MCQTSMYNVVDSNIMHVFYFRVVILSLISSYWGNMFDKHHFPQKGDSMICYIQDDLKKNL